MLNLIRVRCMWMPDDWPIGLEFRKPAYWDGVYNKVIVILEEHAINSEVIVEVEGVSKSVRITRGEGGSLEAEDANVEIRKLRYVNDDRVLSEIFKKLLGIGGEKGCFEIWRMSRLRQAGLAYLVKYAEMVDRDQNRDRAEEASKKASYTRLTHAGGCLYLGDIALENVKVDGEPLVNRIDDRLRRNFLLALFLHDIGHFPFSHVLENCTNILAAGIKDKYISIDLIRGGPLSHVLRELIAIAELNYDLVHEVLEHYEEEEQICRECISALIDKNYQRNCSHYRDDKLFEALQELVDGIIDIDRLDHYNRDDVNLGVGVLGGGVMDIIESVKIGKKIGVYVEYGKAPIAEQLLTSKKLLWKRQLDTYTTRCYESILISAVDSLIDKGFHICDVMFLIDEWLGSTLSKYVKEIISCIKDPPTSETEVRVLEYHWSPPINHVRKLCSDIFRLAGGNVLTTFWHGGGFSESPLVDLPVRVRKDEYKMLNELVDYVRACDEIRYLESLGRRKCLVFLIPLAEIVGLDEAVSKVQEGMITPPDSIERLKIRIGERRGMS